MGCLQSGPKIDGIFYPIGNNFRSLRDLQQGLKRAGLESSELIIGVDFTKSNIYNGLKSFNTKSLHATYEEVMNPYQFVLKMICQTLAAFDDDHKIPCYGFGCSYTRDKKLFTFKDDDEPCYGLEQVQKRYVNVTQNVTLAGPTSFAPIIRQAINIVVKNDYRYHILLVIADGQVSDIALKDTYKAIEDASHFPLSIVMIGVGDGPWDTMRTFDDELPVRKFDNFQFVPLTTTIEACRKNKVNEKVGFALQALMEIPDQYKLIKKLKLMRPSCLQKKIHCLMKLRKIQLLRPPSEVEAALIGLPGMRSIDVPLSDFDPIFILKPGAKLKQLSRRSSAPDVRALMAGQQNDPQKDIQPKKLPRTMSTDRMVHRKSSCGQIIVSDMPRITRSGSSQDNSEYVENLLKQNRQLSKFSLF